MRHETINRTLAKAKELEHLENSRNILDFPSKLRELRKNVAPNLLKKREGWKDFQGNPQMVDYIEWHTVADILDETTPNWAHTVKDVRQIDKIITVTVAITIDGITREGIGTGVAGSEMGIKKAEHDALKRASVKFGVARELYKKRSNTFGADTNEPIRDYKHFPTNPLANSLSDLITAKQLGMIRAISRERNINAGKECQKKMYCAIDELSKKAASSLITYLQEFEPTRNYENKVPMRSVG